MSVPTTIYLIIRTSINVYFGYETWALYEDTVCPIYIRTDFR